MLNELHIENIAVIEKADIEFAAGLNVLTGETGAGKSIIIDSIGAVLGERVDTSKSRAIPQRMCYVYVNLKGMTSEQKQYNRYAPILMTSVDTDPELCAQERNAIMQRLGPGKWQVFGAHGAMKEYEISAV